VCVGGVCVLVGVGVGFGGFGLKNNTKCV
jgi:hypothetical protein